MLSYFRAVALGLILFTLVGCLLGTTRAKAQHVHPDEVITDERVARFYQNWKVAPRRIVSCCSSKDCYAAQIRRGPNGLQYFHKWSATWANIPPAVLEENQSDPHDSPNTENHVCANPYNPDLVYCAVRSSGS